MNLVTTIKNETGGPVYDLFVEVKTSRHSNISRTIVDVNNEDFANAAFSTIGGNDVVQCHLTMKPGKNVPAGNEVQLGVAVDFHAKPGENISFQWWWSDQAGNKILPGGAVPEPGTWAMLAGLGLAGFAVGRRAYAQRAGCREHPKSS